MSAAAPAVPTAFALRAAFLRRGVRLQVTLWFVTLLLGAAAAMKPLADARSGVDLQVHDQNGLLLVAWKSGIAAHVGITDGAWRIGMEIPPQLSTITYQRHTSDVAIVLVAQKREGRAHFVSGRGANIAQLIDDMDAIAAEARAGRIQIESNLWRISRMQRSADRMLDRIASARPAQSPPVVKPRLAPTWWRY